MTRLIIPLLLIIAAIGLFVAYTDPTYQSDQKLAAQAASYDDALNKSQELRTARDQLLAKYDTFSTNDKRKLEEVLPDNVDNIRLILDINNIAARHQLPLQNVQLGEVSQVSTAQSALAVGASGDAVGSVTLGFTVAANYQNFLAFLQDIEHSLRLMDVEKITFKAGQGDVNQYSFTVRTYWLH